MATTVAVPGAPDRSSRRDIGFAVGIVIILTVLFLPLPAIMIDVGLAFSIAFAVLILMVSLWIHRPLEFSAFPTVLLIATMLRLSLNVATTRLILSNGAEGHTAAGHVIAGFANFVMGGDFVIGTVVFVILITVNFLVITKGATRIAEVGARFTLDAIPGKQMAIDADLSAGNIDEKEAMRRRRELEEESAFFGSMDGASKFVRGDAIAGLIITAVNVFGGIIIGVTRHDMDLGHAADVFVRLSVGDGLVTQIPALIISLAAGLLVSKGGTRGSAEMAVFSQLGNYPRALGVAGAVLLALAVAPGLPFLPFALLAGGLIFVSISIPKKLAEAKAAEEAVKKEEERRTKEEARQSVKEQLKTAEVEISLGKQLSTALLSSQGELAHRVGRMRRAFAKQYGFVVPEIRISDDIAISSKTYQIKIHGTVVASEELRIGDVLVITGDGPVPDVPGDEAREPAFGMKALWVSEMFANTVKREGFNPVDPMSVMLTHLREVIRGNLSQLLSYKDMRSLIDRLEPEYRRLVDEIIPSQLSYSGLQAVLKLLLAERISIRNLHLILESIAEIAPHVRRAEQLAEHVRMRMAQQICGDLADAGVLKVLRLGNRWDLAFHQSLKRDAKGEVVEFDIDPRLIEQFGAEASKVIRGLLDQGHQFVLVSAPDARPYVRMVTERLFPTLPVLSHLEIARGVQVKALGTIS
ncbi:MULTISPECIES: flagellar biosynthesis protein FlhA [Hyphomicrobium]|jgi:flagellar biosynthesis protein FlhA|uniref:flagellar biosynthesis protein FlhA n=1 Tax=Hyphomicrobium TaxID=81 RepID=UPI0003711B5B|nr:MULTISPECIES: flagellar biosynthesis protein FlhA [Hyphomicrobium]WBT39243.1 flagellar biosynthesis protein FlhA [Hyphomicrobium sp. DMF-1]HML43032.1 flagellar biosynthesis protein FlhA [Hyphomicrobium zavarzinii]